MADHTDDFVTTLLKNPMVRIWFVSNLMRALGVLGGVLVTKGWLTPEQASVIDWQEVAGTIFVGASFLYGMWRSFKTQQKIVTIIANPQLQTEAEAEQVIAAGGAASVTTPKTQMPTGP